MRMEQVRDGEAVPITIHVMMAHWRNAIARLHQCRQNEIINATNRHSNHTSQHQKEKGKHLVRKLISPFAT